MSGAWHVAGPSRSLEAPGKVALPPGLQFERWPLPRSLGSQVIAVAVRTDLLAVVEAGQATKIWVQGLRGGHVHGEGFTLRAPGPVRVLRLSQDATPGSPSYLACATARECCIFQAIPGSEALVLDLEVLPPHLPSLSFDESGSLLAVAGAGQSSNITVVQSLEAAPFATASVPSESDENPVQACCFLRGSFAYVLAAAQVNSFFLYDLRKGTNVAAEHEQPLTHSVTAMSAHLQEGVLLLGSHGKVMIFQVRHGLKCSALAELALGADVPMWLKDEVQGTGQSVTSQRPDHGVLALAAASCKVRGPAGLGLHGSAAVAVSSEGLFAVLGHEHTAERLCSWPALGTASAAVESTGASILVAVGHAFDAGGELLRLSWPELQVESQIQEEGSAPIHTTALSSILQDAQDSASAGPSDPPICSVVPLGPIAPESMLGRALAQSNGTRRAGSMPVTKRHSGSKTPSNLPVTFHRKVKSAGYGPPTEPPRVLGRPRINSRPAAPKPDFGPRAVGHRPPSAGRVPESGPRMGPPLEHSPDMAIRACEGYAATDVCFSPQATHLLVAGSDRTVSAYRMPLKQGPKGPPGSSHGSRPLGLAGHQGEILSMCPSYTESHSTGGGGGPLLLTAGDDRTARLWALAGPHAGSELIRFDRLKGSRQASSVVEENPPFEQVQDAQFLCLDGAVALATTSRLAVYRFQLHLQDTSDDIKRLQRLGSYKCCGLLALPKEPTAGQSLVAVAANNAVLSATVLVASSNKRVYVWDVAAEKVLAAVNAHTRPLTCLRLAQPHAAASASMDVFYSSGLDGVVKLWDLRSMQECQSFRGGHINTAQRMRCRLSPCMRYLGTPSEDGSVCVYDVRTGQVLGTKHCHRDACVAVDLQPRTGSMVSCGFDGMVHFFRAPGGRTAGGGGGIREPRERESKAGLREVEMELP